jgi:signal transduction histidine kinase
MRRYIPRVLTGLRMRLFLAFMLVVAIALGLMFATLPRLLDGYFLDQANQELIRRTNNARLLVVREIVRYQSSGGAARPILEGEGQLAVSEGLRAALGTAEEGFLLQLADNVALADVTITIAAERDAPTPVYEATVPLSAGRAAEFEQQGQAREELSQSEPFEVTDLFWSQSPAGAPVRIVTMTVSNPYTFRAQTLETIVSVMGVAALIVLIVAMIASILIADRLSNPIRRLTGAARELSEGRLETRVTPPGNSREMADLTTAFNSMAERVQESIEYIRRDRDRSRDFLADVSHELRTPIAAMRTFNELLTDGQVADEATRREFLEQTRQQIERLDWLAQNLLELSKLESGLVLLDLRPDDLRAVVESALQQAQPSADRKGVRLVADLPAEPIRQRHDPQRMGQVIANLLGNAIKFTPSGGQVRVRLDPTRTGAEVRVEDTGVGINPQELPFVFERFYRGAEANELRAAGSGLGLSIVRSIVEMHNGRVSITSKQGKGTEVSVALPRDISVSSSAPVPA